MASLSGMKLGGCELLEEIGQGGMGLIYRARQVSLDRIVAVKILAEHRPPPLPEDQKKEQPPAPPPATKKK